MAVWNKRHCWCRRKDPPFPTLLVSTVEFPLLQAPQLARISYDLQVNVNRRDC